MGLGAAVVVLFVIGGEQTHTGSYIGKSSLVSLFGMQAAI